MKHDEEVYTNVLVGLLRRTAKRHPVIFSAGLICARRHDPQDTYQRKYAGHIKTD